MSPTTPLDGADSAKQPLSATVARGLREAIMDGQLRPNDRIKQDLVARQFGVSRSPVREAFLELAAEGFIELERDVGARVSAIETRELEQLYLAREAIEPIIIAETCRHITSAQLVDADELNVACEASVAAKDLRAYVDLDRQMHFVLLRASRLDVLCDLASGLWDRTHRYRVAISQSPSLDYAFDEHRLLLDALARGAADDSADIYRIHTRRTRVTLSERQHHQTAET